MMQQSISPMRRLVFLVTPHAKSGKKQETGKTAESFISWHRFLMNVSEGTKKLVFSAYDVTTEPFKGKQFVCASCVENGERRSCSTFSAEDILEHAGKCPGCGKYTNFIPKEFAI